MNNATWMSGAKGYVHNGQVVSQKPIYDSNGKLLIDVGVDQINSTSNATQTANANNVQNQTGATVSQTATANKPNTNMQTAIGSLGTTNTNTATTAAAAANTTGTRFAAATAAEKAVKMVGGELGKGVVILSDEQVDRLLESLGLDAFDHYISKLANFIIKNKANVASHYDTIMKWWRADSGS